MRVRVLFDQTVYQNCEDKSYWVCGNANENTYLDPTLRKVEKADGTVHRQLEINGVTDTQLQNLQTLKDADLIVELFISPTDSELPVNFEGKSFNEYIKDEDYIEDVGH